VLPTIGKSIAKTLDFQMTPKSLLNKNWHNSTDSSTHVLGIPKNAQKNYFFRKHIKI
jgi:hypothetical protein